MANLNRILGMASKVIDQLLQKRGQTGSAGAVGQPPAGGTDWRQIVRTAADRLTGDDRSQHQGQQYGQQSAPQYGQPQPGALSDADRVAIAKYDYLLRTAPPERLEQVHHDAFARLTPAQRQEVRNRLNSELPPHEHLRDDDPGSMARAATRGEVSRPGLLRRVLGGRGGSFAGGAAVGAGAMAIGGLGAAVAGGAIVSAAAGPLLAEAVGSGIDFDGIAAGIGDLGGLGDSAHGLLGEGEQLLGGFGEQASDLGSDFLGGLFDR